MLPNRFMPILLVAGVQGAFLSPGAWAGARVPQRSRPLLISAASSLATALPEIAATFERETGLAVDLNLAASSSLAVQIGQGAPVDLFLSADVAQMDRVERAVGLLAGTRIDLLSNRLVVAVPASGGARIEGLSDLAGSGVRRIAVGDPVAVPAGVYARAYLERAGLWSRLEPKLIPMANVRAVLAVVASGDADAGLVYRTDAAVSDAVRVAATVPPSGGPRIVYPVAIPRAAPSPAAARRLLAYLAGPEAGRVFERLGFIRLRVPGADRGRGPAGIERGGRR